MEKKKRNNTLTQLIWGVFKRAKSKKETTEYVSGKTDHVCSCKCSTVKCTRPLKSEPITIERSHRSKTHNLMDSSNSDPDDDPQCISSSVLSDPIPSSFRHCNTDNLFSSFKGVEGTPLMNHSPLPGSFTVFNTTLRSDPSATTRMRRLSLHEDRETLALAQEELSPPAGLNGAVSYWKLPWSQSMVVMCPYCHRPRTHFTGAPLDDAATSTRAVRAVEGGGADHHAEDEHEEDCFCEMHCRCPVGATLDPPARRNHPHLAGPTAEDPSMTVSSTPIFLAVTNLPLRTRTSEAVSEEFDPTNAQEARLSVSLVAPLTNSRILQTRSSRDSADEQPKASPLMSWLREQRNVKSGKQI
ncbi:unnamed protein product [Phytomonas sp. Hart1]|nr:unnamed protein product [Phytomonas sp. Hart1]|eukprot:CCW66546.1 unnamed protein product [Phytomonas sp. isolate Hart1]